jgi:DNA-binding transcriptional regulator/RsmH inhibitor MraZ
MLMGATAVEVHYDRQHRLRFPERLLRRAGISRGDEDERSVMVVGHFEDLRFWDRERWATFSAEAERSYGADLERALAPASAPSQEPAD